MVIVLQEIKFATVFVQALVSPKFSRVTARLNFICHKHSKLYLRHALD